MDKWHSPRGRLRYVNWLVPTGEYRADIAPTTMIDMMVPHEAGRDLVSMRSGLIPSWLKKAAKEVPSIFNARPETRTMALEELMLPHTPQLNCAPFEY